MAIIGNGTEIGADSGTGNLYVQTAGTNRLVYNFTNGTLSEPSNVYAMITGGFGGDVTAGANNYLDPASVNNSNGTFTFSGGRFTCPRTGAYRMTATALCRTNWHHWAARNDGQVMTGSHNTGPAGYSSLHWSWIQFANAGDTLSFRGNQNSGRIWGGGWSMYNIAYIG